MPDDIVARLRVRQLLELADVVYGADDEGGGRGAQTLNMNDVFGWALAWGAYVPDAELPRVAELFTRYGSAGLYYWVSERHENIRSEFHDVNRAIEFVRHEEELRKRMPSSSERAYARMSYTLGGVDILPATGVKP